ncbi:MAG: poly(R)-hydroxyalkanoic acid synthase subunit PhaE [Haloferacaceae archaeon]
MANDASTPFDGRMESFVERMTETYMSAIDQNLEAQSELMEAWMDATEENLSEENVRESYEGSLQAYEAWMNAAERSFDRIGDALEGEDVDATEFRDIWLASANEAFKETMATTAFAAATGQSVEDALNAQQQVEEMTEESLHAVGFATVGDVREVGERLVELERRTHAIESKLDRLLEEQ